MLTDAYSVFLRLSAIILSFSRGWSSQKNQLQSPNNTDPMCWNQCEIRLTVGRHVVLSEVPKFGDGSKPYWSILYRILKGWTCGTSIHQLFCWVHHRIPWWHGYPQPSGCVMLFMFGYAKNHWYPAATFLGGWLGLKTWIQPRNGWTVPVWRLSRLGQVEHGPSLPQIFSRFQVTPFETMIGFETNSGAHHLPSTSNYIDYIHITIYELRTIFVT